MLLELKFPILELELKFPMAGIDLKFPMAWWDPGHPPAPARLAPAVPEPHLSRVGAVPSPPERGDLQWQPRGGEGSQKGNGGCSLSGSSELRSGISEAEPPPHPASLPRPPLVGYQLMVTRGQRQK